MHLNFEAVLRGDIYYLTAENKGLLLSEKYEIRISYPAEKRNNLKINDITVNALADNILKSQKEGSMIKTKDLFLVKFDHKRSFLKKIVDLFSIIMNHFRAEKPYTLQDNKPRTDIDQDYKNLQQIIDRTFFWDDDLDKTLTETAKEKDEFINCSLVDYNRFKKIEKQIYQAHDLINKSKIKLAQQMSYIDPQARKSIQSRIDKLTPEIRDEIKKELSAAIEDEKMRRNLILSNDLAAIELFSKAIQSQTYLLAQKSYYQLNDNVSFDNFQSYVENVQKEWVFTPELLQATLQNFNSRISKFEKDIQFYDLDVNAGLNIREKLEKSKLETPEQLLAFDKELTEAVNLKPLFLKSIDEKLAALKPELGVKKGPRHTEFETLELLRDRIEKSEELPFLVANYSQFLTKRKVLINAIAEDKEK